MSTKFYVAAFWGPRPESGKKCALRLESCLTALAQIHPAISAWQPRGRSEHEALASKRVPLETAALAELVESGRTLDDDGFAMDNLGYGVSLWNGNPKEWAAFSMRAGLYTAVADLKNSFILSPLPAPTTTTAELYTSDGAIKTLEAVIDAWEPDWASWTSAAMRTAQPWSADAKPVIGWATYFEAGLFSKIATDLIPPNATVHPKDKGAIISFSTDPTAVTGEDIHSMSAALAPLLQ